MTVFWRFKRNRLEDRILPGKEVVIIQTGVPNATIAKQKKTAKRSVILKNKRSECVRENVNGCSN